jgi:ABC-type branched-subunit amino acid transport system ATPase component/ABC-type branched-subunit amino acid transport system permease subunit
VSRLRAHASVLVLIAALAVAPLALPDYLEDVLSRALMLGVFAMSLDLLLGYTGLFSLGHAAFLGVGGYAAGMLMVRYGVESLWIGLVAAVVVAALVAALFGLLALRVQGVYFLLVTFALAELCVALARDWSFINPIGFGTEGLIGIGMPSLSFAESPVLTPTDLYFVASCAVVLTFMALRFLLRTPLGLAAQGVREREHRMRALGFNTWSVKYAIYVVGAMFAGVAGALLAYHDGIAVPETFNVEMSTLVLLMVLVGGAGTLYGPLIGAVLLVFGEYYASSEFPERWPLILGGLFVATVMLARRGLVLELFEAVRGRVVPAREVQLSSNLSAADAAAAAEPAPAEPWTPGGEALAVAGLTKHFGGVHAVQDVSLTVSEGERLAVIGTNGAGKSTLFKLVAGDLPATEGTVSLFGEDITGTPVHRRAHLGIGRSFQTTSLFPAMTVWTNAWLAVQGVQPWRMQARRSARSHHHEGERLEALLREWGLWELRDAPVSELAYGDQRRLEIVVALASKPRVLLMDEPTAGQTMEESQALGRHLRRLPRDVTVVVIAHDMDLVFSVADRIVVMHEGRIVAEGTGEEIAGNAAVQESYMGAAVTAEERT